MKHNIQPTGQTIYIAGGGSYRVVKCSQCGFMAAQSANGDLCSLDIDYGPKFHEPTPEAMRASVFEPKQPKVTVTRIAAPDACERPKLNPILQRELSTQ